LFPEGDQAWYELKALLAGWIKEGLEEKVPPKSVSEILVDFPSNVAWLLLCATRWSVTFLPC